MSAPYTMLCCNLGDLWKIWPDGRCCPIEDEDDLRDPRKIDELEPSPDSRKHLLKAHDGQIIVWCKCSSCDGTGTYTGTIIFDCDDDSPIRPDWFPHETLQYRTFRDSGSMPCPDCNATGREPLWTGERVLVEALAGKGRAA